MLSCILIPNNFSYHALFYGLCINLIFTRCSLYRL